MDDWEKFNKISIPENYDFYSHLNMEDITDADYEHSKRVYKNFQSNNLGEYHDFYVQRDTLLLVDLFESFQNMCIEIHKLNTAYFRTALGLAWQAALKIPR